MQRTLPIFLILACFSSACGTALQSDIRSTVALTATNTTAYPTSTQTPSPSVNPTTTLLPDPNSYECDNNVAPEDCSSEFLAKAAELGRRYLLEHFGTDLSTGITFRLENDVNAATVGRQDTGFGYLADFNQPGKKPYILINVANAFWSDYADPAYQYRRVEGIIHEQTHWWQVLHGCLAKRNPAPSDFMLEGAAEYTGYMATGHAETMDPSLAIGEWQRAQWNDTAFFNSSVVAAMTLKALLDEHGETAYTEWCDLVGQGSGRQEAFQKIFGLSISDFLSHFKMQVLGQAADCTVATCGSGDPVGAYTMKDVLEAPGAEPNADVKFVDQDGSLVVLTNVLLCKQTVDLPSACRQPAPITGEFTAALQPGRYAFFFCEPGYPGADNSFKCKAHETDWFDVIDGQIFKQTFQIPSDIFLPDLPEPNLEVYFADSDGNPLPTFWAQLCNIDSPVKVCNGLSNAFPTDADGIVRYRVRPGAYVLRFTWPGAGYAAAGMNMTCCSAYQTAEIHVGPDGVAKGSYQFATPNLILRLLDVNGSPVPDHEFVLCRATRQAGNCSISSSLWGYWAGTDDPGVFQAHLDPGDYLIVTNKDYSNVEAHVDFKDPFTVDQTPAVTTIDFRLNK